MSEVSQIAGLNTCRICGRRFTSRMGMIITNPTEARRQQDSIMREIAALWEHLIKHHPKQAETVVMLTEQYRGFLVLCQFESTDPNITKSRDQMRWHIHNATAAATVPDDKLEERTVETARTIAARLITRFDNREVFPKTSAALKYALNVVPPETTKEEEERRITEEVADVIRPIFRGLRDVLQEPGKFEPLSPVPAENSTSAS